MELLKTQEEIRLDRAIKRVKALKGFYKHLIIYVAVNSALLFIKYYQLQPDENFFEIATFSTLFYWGIGLVLHAINVFAKNNFLGNNWEERKINEYIGQDQNSKRE